jgi:hypothetical protein
VEYSYRERLYTVKINEIQPCTSSRVNLISLIFSEINKSKKNTFSIIHLQCSIICKINNILLNNPGKSWEWKNTKLRSVIISGRKRMGKVMVWSNGIVFGFQFLH